MPEGVSDRTPVLRARLHQAFTTWLRPHAPEEVDHNVEVALRAFGSWIEDQRDAALAEAVELIAGKRLVASYTATMTSDGWERISFDLAPLGPVADSSSDQEDSTPEVHRPFPDDGVTYCGWDKHDGCGEVWPCSTVRARSDQRDSTHE